VATHTEGPGETWAHWESPYEDPEPPPREHGDPRYSLPPRPGLDFGPLMMVLEAARRGVPRELEEQFNALVREILLTIRALIDWYLERLDNGPAEPKVEDIPID
jgi:hypothetical protein